MAKITSTDKQLRSVGRRKSAAARVKIDKGSGVIMVNGKDFKTYFPYFEMQQIVLAPLKVLGKEKDLDFSIKVSGGGKKVRQ